MIDRHSLKCMSLGAGGYHAWATAATIGSNMLSISGWLLRRYVSSFSKMWTLAFLRVSLSPALNRLAAEGHIPAASSALYSIHRRDGSRATSAACPGSWRTRWLYSPFLLATGLGRDETRTIELEEQVDLPDRDAETGDFLQVVFLVALRRRRRQIPLENLAVERYDCPDQIGVIDDEFDSAGAGDQVELFVRGPDAEVILCRRWRGEFLGILLGIRGRDREIDGRDEVRDRMQDRPRCLLIFARPDRLVAWNTHHALNLVDKLLEARRGVSGTEVQFRLQAGQVAAEMHEQPLRVPLVKGPSRSETEGCRLRCS